MATEVLKRISYNQFPYRGRVVFDGLSTPEGQRLIPVICTTPQSEFVRVTYMDPIAYRQTEINGRVVSYSQEVRGTLGESIVGVQWSYDNSLRLRVNDSPTRLNPIELSETDAAKHVAAGLSFDLRSEGRLQDKSVATAVLFNGNKPVFVGRVDSTTFQETLPTAHPVFWRRSSQGLWVQDRPPINGIQRLRNNAVGLFMGIR